jgi:hypothetical protein
VRTGVLAGLTERELAALCAEHGVVPDIVVRGLDGDRRDAPALTRG